MSNRPIRSDNSKFLFKISLISNGRFKGALQANPVVGVNPFPKYVQRRIGGLRIKTENSEMLLRPRQFSGGCVPSPTPRVAEPLPICEECLAAANGLFGTLALRDIHCSADQFDKLSVPLDAVNNHVQVFHRAVRHEQPMLEINLISF